MNATTIHATLEEATAARTGKAKVYLVTFSDTTWYVVSGNSVRAGNAVLIAAGGKVEVAGKAPKPMTAAEVLAAYAALTDEQRKELAPMLKKAK